MILSDSAFAKLFLDEFRNNNFAEEYQRRADIKAEIMELIAFQFKETSELKILIEPEAQIRLFKIYFNHLNELVEIWQPIPKKLLEYFDLVIESIWKIRRYQKTHDGDLDPDLTQIFSDIFLELLDIEVSDDFVNVFSNSTENLILMSRTMLLEFHDIAFDYSNFDIVLKSYTDFLEDLEYLLAECFSSDQSYVELESGLNHFLNTFFHFAFLSIINIV